MKKNKTKIIAFSAVMCALGTIMLYIGAVIDIADITTAAFSSFIILICMIEIGGYVPFLVYGVTSVLSFILLPNKGSALLYIIFFGFYPILKKYLEKLPKLLSWALKFAVFNVFVIMYLYIAHALLHIETGSMKIYIVILLNVIFFTFDLVLSLFVTTYVLKLRKRLGLDKFFRSTKMK